MSYYYININPQGEPEDGEHEVHNGDNHCPKPPLPENRKRVGSFYDCKDAIREAKRQNPSWKIDGCAYCNSECNER